MMDTNIPKQEVVPFTKSMLYHPLLKGMDDLSEYPYFTMDVFYPDDLINRMSYTDQVRFFFNRGVMENILIRRARPNTDKTQTPYICEKNIITMLRALFPTKYPYKNNLFDSFSILTEKPDVYFNFLDILPSTLLKLFVKERAEYSYLKINGKVYTVTQVIWLNDLYNHTEYKDLIDKLTKLDKFKNNELEKVQKELQKKYSILKEKYKKIKSPYSPELLNEGIWEKLKEGAERDRSGNEIRRYNIAQEKINIINNSILALIDGKSNTLNETWNGKEMIDLMKTSILDNHNLLKRSEYRIYYSVTNDIQKFMDGLERDINDIRYLEYVIGYLNKKGINMDIENDNPQNRDRFKSRYPIYSNFIDTIKRFILPYRESTNPQFQETFEQFISNTEVNGLFNILLDPANRKKTLEDVVQILNSGVVPKGSQLEEQESWIKYEDINKTEEEYKNRKNTGVTILSSAKDNEPLYQIYVQMNTVGGELTDDNYSVIDCMYKGEYLGENLEYLLNSSLRSLTGLNTGRIFFDITQGDAKKVIEEAAQPTEAKVEEPKGPPVEGKKKGGDGPNYTKKMRMYNIRNRFMKTMRKY